MHSDFDETLMLERVDPELAQRHIFDFRFRTGTGNGAVFLKTGSSNNRNRKSKSILSECSQGLAG